MRMAPVMFRRFRYLFVIFTIIAMALTPGCGEKNSSWSGSRNPAENLLVKGLDFMNETNSYRFKGTGVIDYPDVKDRGTFIISGEYQRPGLSRSHLEMTLGRASYYVDTYYKNGVFYSLFGETWSITPFDPNTLMQPAHKPVNLLLEHLRQVAGKPVLEGNVRSDGHQLQIISIKASQKKLKSLIQKEFDKAVAHEPERRQGMMNFLKILTIDQDYTLYIEPNSGMVVKILFRQVVRLNLPNSGKESHLSIDYTVSDFGSAVKLPSVP